MDARFINPFLEVAVSVFERQRHLLNLFQVSPTQEESKAIGDVSGNQQTYAYAEDSAGTRGRSESSDTADDEFHTRSRTMSCHGGGHSQG